jgi:hypothetical protein
MRTLRILYDYGRIRYYMARACGRSRVSAGLLMLSDLIEITRSH